MTTQPSGSAATQYVAVVKVTGDSLAVIARRLEDAAYDLEVKARAGCDRAEIIGGHSIVTVREADRAPKVDWREDQVV